MQGKWITGEEFCGGEVVNVFHRQLEKTDVKSDKRQNRHILFRKKFYLQKMPDTAEICITADDYYKLYINGSFVSQGPSPGYHNNYYYNRVDITSFVRKGENLIAVHVLYQGLINRVWQSGDGRCGLIFDIVADGKSVAESDETVRMHYHTGYRTEGIVGYDTQFMETYDSTSAEVGFELPEFDDSGWCSAVVVNNDDHVLVRQKTKMLCFENIPPASIEQTADMMLIDFGAMYAGELRVQMEGRRGERITVLCGQELNEDGTVRYETRSGCIYKETWILDDGINNLEWFDYKAFRYAVLIMNEGNTVHDIYLRARHYPFELKASLDSSYSHLQAVWNMCVHTQKYGVQEVVQDCLDREKGCYIGDGCYTALTNMVLTEDDSMVRRLIDDAFSSAFITDGLVTCLNCSFMQEIAEYPLILVNLVLWHYRLTGDKEYLGRNYPKVCRLLDSYRRDYEEENLLNNLDKWCVVEWPAEYRHGYDVNLKEGEVCRDSHVVINAYYVHAVRCANSMASELGLPLYRDSSELEKAFNNAFFDAERNIFRDSVASEHVSLVGNIYPYAFGLCPNAQTERNITEMIMENKISSLSIFCTFPTLAGLVRRGEKELLEKCLSDEGAWLRMISEGATVTFECWGKEAKWNTSLFHLTLSYGALFLADADINGLFK